MKLRFGKLVRHKSGPRKGHPRVYNPGFAFTLPTVHSLKRQHIRATTINCHDQTVVLADGTVFTMSAMIVHHVHDDPDAIYRVLFVITDLETSVENHCMAILREIVQSKTSKQLLEDTAEISDEMAKRARPRLEEWGVDLDAFELTDCSPTAETTRMLLAGAETKVRTDALNKAAEDLGTTIDKLDPSLAAALVGAPLVTSIGTHRVQRPTGVYHDEDEE